jgi:hypothetical protein
VIRWELWTLPPLLAKFCPGGIITYNADFGRPIINMPVRHDHPIWRLGGTR